MGLFASKDYLKRRGTPSRVSDLSAHEFIGFRVGSMKGPLVLTSPQGSERVQVGGGIEADDLLFVHRLIVAGAGVGLLPLFLIGCGAKHEREGLVRVLPDWSLTGPALSVVAPSASLAPRRVRLFRDFLLAEAKRLGFGDP